MNFSELDNFIDCTKLCQAISNLPNVEEKQCCCIDDSKNGNCDCDTCDDEVVKFKAMPMDPETTPSNTYVNVPGNTIDYNKSPIFGSEGAGKYGCVPVTYDEVDNIVKTGCGINNITSLGLDNKASLGYEAPYSVGDFIKLKDENMPHIFIIVSTDGPDLELAKPTANRSEFRTIGDGVWPRSRCNYNDISHKVTLPLELIEYIISSNDHDDTEILDKLCPGCTEMPVQCTRPFCESFDGKSFDDTPMKKAQEIKKNNICDRTPNHISPTIFDENGKLKQNTEEIFDEINSRMNEIWGEPYSTAMKNPKAKCNSIYNGGSEVIISSKPIELA